MSRVSRVALGYVPREPLVAFHKRKQRWACIVAHRRAGKTVAAINDLIDAALRCEKSDPRFAYIAPYYAQAKDVAWGYLKRFTGPIPGVEVNEAELRVDLPNGGRVRLYGADNYDRMRGIYLDGVVLDEYADMHPRAWSEVIRPALSDRKGWAAFIGTPKGRNAFFDLYDKGTRDELWFTLRLKASETGLIPPDELDGLRRELSFDEYEREFETNFDAAIEGAYFAPLLAQAQREGRITEVAADPLLSTRAVCDIGGSGAGADAMAIWIVQWVGQKVLVLDYIEGVGQVLGYYASELRKRGWEQAKVVLPHDGVNSNNVTGKRYEDHWREAGFATEVIKNQGRGAAMMRIEAARRLFPRIWFDEQKTDAGRAALAFYHERRDEKRNVGLGPDHDWSSHAADAFGLMCVAYEEPQMNNPAPRRSIKGLV